MNAPAQAELLGNNHKVDLPGEHGPLMARHTIMPWPGWVGAMLANSVRNGSLMWKLFVPG